MDIFSTITSTIDLVSKVIGYIKAVKGSKKDRLELLSEVSALGALLEILRGKLDSGSGGGDDSISGLLKAGIMGPLHQCYEDLQSIVRKLERIASPTNTGKSFLFLAKMKDVTWPFLQDDVKTMLDKMERLKSLISLALQSSVMEFIEKTRDELMDLGLNVKEIKDTVLALEGDQKAHMRENESLRIKLRDLVTKFQDSAGSIAKVEDKIVTLGKNQRDQMMRGDQMQADLIVVKNSVHSQELQDLIEWLSPLDFGEKHNTMFEKRARDTGGWFLKHPKFLAWKRGDPGYETLWCPGNPGVGKSVMMSLVIHELGKEIPDNVALVFIYFEYKTKYTGSQLAEVMLKQLVQQHVTQSGLESLRKHKMGKRPTYEELLNMLKVEVRAYNRILVVIDALDEADIQIWTQFLGRFRALHNISLIATSRGMGEIELELRPCQRLDITVDGGDMRKYIEGRLESSMKFKRLRRDVHEEIVIGIMNKADGMFLLAQLHMNSLETKHRVVDLRQALNKLPNTLDATYDEAMSRIGDDNKELANRIISWLIHAAQPMTICDLQYALAVEDGMAALDRDYLHDEASFTSICVGLVVLQEDTASSKVAGSRPGNKVIGLVHYTAQEYFLHNPKVSEQFANSPNFAITCLQYLAFDIFKAGEPLDFHEPPFSEYAMLSWGVHARTYYDDKTVRDLAMELLHDSQRVARVGSLPCHAKNPSAIHLCTHFGLKEYLEFLLDNGYDVNLKDSDGDTAVTYAALGGQEEILQLLLAREGVNVQPQGWGGRTPLAQAIVERHEATVRLLLARNDLNVNRCDDFGITPIIYAAWRGHGGIVKLLLARDDVDINLRDQDGFTPLSTAVRYQHEAVVQILLARKDLDVNLHGNSGVTPIIDAAQRGHSGIVKLLLARDDVNINLQDSDGATPLSAAASRGHEAIVRILLAREDLDVNLCDYPGKTPITHAAQGGYSGVVELLLARDDVDVNFKSRRGTTPLSAAVKGGHEPIVRILLARKDLDVNGHDDSWNKLIRLAARRGHHSIAKLLQARKDVDINVQDTDCTSLPVTVTWEREAVGRLLALREILDYTI